MPSDGEPPGRSLPDLEVLDAAVGTDDALADEEPLAAVEPFPVDAVGRRLLEGSELRDDVVVDEPLEGVTDRTVRREMRGVEPAVDRVVETPRTPVRARSEERRVGKECRL